MLGVGDLLFGKAVPAGRLNQMVYPAAYVNQSSLFDMGLRPGASVWPPFTNPGRTHRFYTGKPVLPFGFGLSYTTFQYTMHSMPTTVSHTHIRAQLQAAAPDLRQIEANFYVNVTNTGPVDADDIVLGFLTPPGAGSEGVPLQQLFGFERVFVARGQTVTVYLGAQLSAFTQVLKSGSRVAWPGTYKVHFGVAETRDLGMGFAEHTLDCF